MDATARQQGLRYSIFDGAFASMMGSLAGRFLMRDLKAGDRISFDSIEGGIVSIDFITTKIRCPHGVIIIPNGQLSMKVLTAIARRKSDTERERRAMLRTRSRPFVAVSGDVPSGSR